MFESVYRFMQILLCEVWNFTLIWYIGVKQKVSIPHESNFAQYGFLKSQKALQQLMEN